MRVYGRRKIGHTQTVTFRGVLLAAVLAALLAPALARAEVRTATVTDPQDAPAPADGAPKSPDLQALKVTYDSGAGTVTATATFYESIAARKDETNITFELGGRPAGTQDCEITPGSTTISALMFAKQGTGLMTVDGYSPLITQSAASLSADGRTFTVRFVRPAGLAGLDLRCAAVDSVWTSAYTDPRCNYFDCPVTKIELDGVHKNAWFDGFAPVPAPPTNVAVTETTGSTLALAWQESDKSVTGFDVLRDGIVVGTTDRTSFIVPGLSCGQAYTLAVRADTPYSQSVETPVSGTTAACAQKAPAHVAVSTTKSSVNVTWGAVTGATSYAVTVGPHSATATGRGVTVTGLRCGTTYTVTVRAIGAGGRSGAAHAVARTKRC